MMAEKNESNIREAIDRIEPAEGAKERMLQNIRAKAAMENATKNAQKKSQRMLWFKLLPAVAAVVIIVVGAIVLKDRNSLKPKNTNEPDGTLTAGGVDETKVVSYSKVEFKDETGEDPELPPLATEVTYHKGYDGYYVAFAKGGHRYKLFLFRPENGVMRYVAVSYVEGVTVEEWEQGDTILRLVNDDGATQEEMKEIKAAIH
ncbi:MAG: hypothetical protein J5648_05255 [Lachnospiraceae bacterium]|nr:hypothetical protein [Lachnospiraceae bacterium]